MSPQHAPAIPAAPFAVRLLYRPQLCPIPSLDAESSPDLKASPLLTVAAATPEEAALTVVQKLRSPLQSGTGIRAGDLVVVLTPDSPDAGAVFEVGVLGVVPVTVTAAE